MSSPFSHAFDRLLPTLLGFSAGVAVGLLLAPDAGRQTRRRLAKGAREATQAAQNQALGLAEPIVERVRETTHELAERHVPLADDWDVVDGKEFLDGLLRSPRR